MQQKMCYSKVYDKIHACLGCKRKMRCRMVSEYTYSPHVDFFIDRVDRDNGYEMPSFHIHHKYEIYYEIEGTRRYFIEDAAYIVNAGSVVLIGENQIHKTAGSPASSCA